MPHCLAGFFHASRSHFDKLSVTADLILIKWAVFKADYIRNALTICIQSFLAKNK